MARKTILLKGYTAAEWAANSEVLRAREPAFLLSESGAFLELRVGDGTKRWSELSNVLGSGCTTAYHGADALAARPAGNWTAVFWIGSAEPTYSVNGDIWFVTT
jgi:hypothetical protein